MSILNYVEMPGQPVVVDLHKIKGLRPHYTVYIGRKMEGTEFTKDSPWANIYPVEKYGIHSLELYEKYARKRLMKHINDLENQVLGCWCLDTDSCEEPLLCHGQVLIKLWREAHSSPCITKKCPFFKNGFCIYSSILGCYLEGQLPRPKGHGLPLRSGAKIPSRHPARRLGR